MDHRPSSSPQVCDGLSDEEACFVMKGIGREFEVDMYTLLYLKWITSKDPLCSTGNSVYCHVAAWMGGGVWERVDTCIRMAESLHCLPETHSIVNRLYTNTK